MNEKLIQSTGNIFLSRAMFPRKDTLRIHQRLRHVTRRNLVGQGHPEFLRFVDQGQLQTLGCSRPLEGRLPWQYQWGPLPTKLARGAAPQARPTTPS